MGKAVFLEAAPGFLGNSVGDEPGVESRGEVVGSECGTVGEFEVLHALQCGERFISKGV